MQSQLQCKCRPPTDYDPSKNIEVSNYVAAIHLPVTQAEQGIGTKRSRATVIKNPAVTEKLATTAKTNSLTSIVAAAAAVAVAAATPAQTALETRSGRWWIQKHEYRAGVEVSIGGSELPELDASYGNWKRVLGNKIVWVI
jgi:hypothetical protein